MPFLDQASPISLTLAGFWPCCALRSRDPCKRWHSDSTCLARSQYFSPDRADSGRLGACERAAWTDTLRVANETHSSVGSSGRWRCRCASRLPLARLGTVTQQSWCSACSLWVTALRPSAVGHVGARHSDAASRRSIAATHPCVTRANANGPSFQEGGAVRSRQSMPVVTALMPAEQEPASRAPQTLPRSSDACGPAQTA